MKPTNTAKWLHNHRHWWHSSPISAKRNPQQLRRNLRRLDCRWRGTWHAMMGVITCTLFDHSDEKGFSPPLTTLLTPNPNCSQPFSGLWNPLGKGTRQWVLEPPWVSPLSPLAYLVEENRLGVMEFTPRFNDIALQITAVVALMAQNGKITKRRCVSYS